MFGFVGVAEVGEDAGGGALGRRGRVVELVGEIAGEFAEGERFLRLLVHAGEVADAVEEERDATLPDGRNGDEHCREEVLVDVEYPDGTGAEGCSAPGLHAGVGELAGDESSAAHEESDGAGLAAVHVDLTAENEGEVMRGLHLRGRAWLRRGPFALCHGWRARCTRRQRGLRGLGWHGAPRRSPVAA